MAIHGHNTLMRGNTVTPAALVGYRGESCLTRILHEGGTQIVDYSNN